MVLIMNKNSWWVLFPIFFLFSITFAQELNIDVYSTNIWTSPNQVFSGQKIRIYTTFKNTKKFDLNANIVFLDNDKEIETKSLPIASNKEATIWFDYIFNYGEHKIETKFKKIESDTLNGRYEIPAPKIIHSKLLSVDNDTDNDGMGDKIDLDDDNDGYSDEIELKKGSNPLSKISTPQTKKILSAGQSILSNIKKGGKSVFENINNGRQQIANNLKEKIQKINNSSNKIKIYSSNSLKQTNLSIKKTKLTTWDKTKLYILNFFYYIFSKPLFSLIFFGLIIWIIIKIIFKRKK